jgi:hypothetical protein
VEASGADRTAVADAGASVPLPLPLPPPLPAPADDAGVGSDADTEAREGGPARGPEIARSLSDGVVRQPAAEPGWLRVVTRPHYAEVYVDGRHEGSTPLLVQARPGRRRVRLVNPQLGRSVERTVVVAAGGGREAPAAVVVDDF